MNALAGRTLTLLAMFGAVVFGMVLASGVELTPELLGAAFDDETQAQRVEADASHAIASFADLAEAVQPAVVLVNSTTIETADDSRGGDPFEFFFRGQRPPGSDGGEPRDFRSDGAGTGFFVSSDGWIVTNNHVVEGATSVEVQLGDETLKAEVRGVDPATDLAVLKVEAGDEPFKYLSLGDSDALRVGDWVMAVGNPLRQIGSVTVGVVSGKGRRIGISPGNDISFEDFIQTDAAINRGNSGGPLVNTSGEVVGIATAMNWGAENIGFAVPVAILKDVLPQLRADGKVSRGYLGVSIVDLEPETAEAFGLESTQGALVQDVVEGTPAFKAGLEAGDVILGVDGQTVKDTRSLIAYVSRQRPGDKVEVQLWRNRKSRDETILLEARPDAGQVAQVEEPVEESQLQWLGIEIQEVPDNMKERLDVEGVLVADVAATSPLWDKNIRPGVVILKVNSQDIGSVAEFEAAVSEAESGSFVRLYVAAFDRAGRRSMFFSIVRKP
jgi:serine protease Do